MGNVSSIVAWVVLVAGALGMFLVRPPPPTRIGNPAAYPAGIGGWLLIPAAGVVLGLIAAVALAIRDFGRLDDNRVDDGLYAFAIYEIALYAVIAAMIAYLGLQFLRRKAIAPRLFSYVLIATTVIFVTDVAYLASLFHVDFFQAVDAVELVTQLAGTAIWVAYFRTSQRVANTFVVP